MSEPLPFTLAAWHAALSDLHQPRTGRAGRSGTKTVCAYDNNRWPCPEARMLGIKRDDTLTPDEASAVIALMRHR